MTARDRRIDALLNVGIWLLFIALLVPAGVVGWAIGRHYAPKKATQAVQARTAAPSPSVSRTLLTGLAVVSGPG